jgi:O-antigen/teichoic acid export membrane protein
VERSEPMPGLHPRARLMSETLAAKWAELVTQALLLLLVPRALGPPAYGEFAVAFGVVSLLSLGLGLGAPLAAIRYVPAVHPSERVARARSMARDVAAGRARLLAVLTVAAVALAPTLLDVPVVVVVAVCAAAWCSVGSSIASELALALRRTRVWNARFPLENSLIVAAAVGGHAALGTRGAIVGMAIASAMTFALLFGGILGELRRAPAGGPLPPEAAMYARLQTLTVVLNTLVTRAGPLAMPLAGASSTETAFAAIATGVGAAGAGTVMSLLAVQLPRLAHEAREVPAHAEEEAQRSGRGALVVAVSAALPAALLTGPAIDLALGSEFAGARSSLALALAAVPLAAVPGLAGLIASLRIRPGRLTAVWAAGAATFAAVAAATIPALAADGAALAMVAGFLATCLTSTLLLGGRTVGAMSVAAVAGAAAVLAAGAAAGALPG